MSTPEEKLNKICLWLIRQMRYTAKDRIKVVLKDVVMDGKPIGAYEIIVRKK